MIEQGCSLRSALRLASALGCTVEHVRGHGEIRVRHPSWRKSEYIHNQRDSATRRLVMLLRRLEKGRR